MILTKEDIIQNIKDKTPIGLQILKIELDYYLDLIKGGEE